MRASILRVRLVSKKIGVEAEIRGQSAEARRAVQQDRAKPAVAALKTWLMDRLAELSGQSVIAGAIHYALGLCEGLVKFLDDGRFESTPIPSSAACARSPSTEGTRSLSTATKAAPIGRCISILHRQIV